MAPPSASATVPSTTSAVRGGPSAPVLRAMHARVGAGAVVPPHTHPDTLTAVIASGTASVGVGEVFEESVLVVYPEGWVFVTEAGATHSIGATGGDLSILDHGSDPSGTALVEPPETR